jgi:hypothetical protein
MPAWAVNKCTGADGKVSFQDAPCAAGKAEALNIKASAGTTPAAALPAASPSSPASRSAITSAILAGKPAIGMSRAELERAMGAPARVNSGNYAGQQKDQLIYERPGETWYIYTENGIVTAMQNQPSITSASDNRPSVNCPTPLEIRNMETSASSNTIPEAVRVELHRQIRDAKRCGK